jgi:hypothetical protein
MKKFLILLLLITITFSANAADFRDVEWGMSKAEVAGREGRQPDYEDEYMMAYIVDLLGSEFALGYMFYKDKLTNARYMLMDESVKGQEYFNLIESLNQGLINSYGEPSGHGILWLDSEYKNDTSNFRMAVKNGNVVVDREYETKNINVYFGVQGEDNEDLFFILYTPKDSNLERLRKQRENE